MAFHSDPSDLPLKLCLVAESETDQIAAVHMAAFGSNAMLQAQFPISSAREEQRSCIAQKAVDDMRDPNIAVVVV